MKEIYDWVPWFKELARKIADGGEQYLADGAKRVQWHDDETIQPLLRHSVENIDPFSFFYSLASRKEHSIVRERIFPSVESVFKLENRLPVNLEDAVIFPHASRRQYPIPLPRRWRPTIAMAAVSGCSKTDASLWTAATLIER